MRSGKGRAPMRQVVPLLVLGLLATACGGGGDQGAAAGQPELDLVTLQADTDVGTLQAEPIPHAYVGAVDDELFIAVALDDGADGQTARVYLCDGAEVSIWLRGDVEPEQPTRLGGFEDGAHVEFVVTDEAVHGEVTLAGQGGPRYFEAVAATGDAGLYRAEETIDGTEYVGGWIALADGRQQGLICDTVCINAWGRVWCWQSCREMN
jgi:hypothetical protein